MSVDGALFLYSFCTSVFLALSFVIIILFVFCGESGLVCAVV